MSKPGSWMSIWDIYVKKLITVIQKNFSIPSAVLATCLRNNLDLHSRKDDFNSRPSIFFRSNCQFSPMQFDNMFGEQKADTHTDLVPPRLCFEKTLIDML